MKLTSVEMFRDLSNMELAKLLGMLERKPLPAGRELFRQGDPGDSMYIVERGRIELYVGDAASGREGERRRRIAVIGEGDVLGEMALLTGEPRSAAAVAADDCMLYVIDRTMFNRLVSDHPAFTVYFVKLLSRRLIATNGRLKLAQDSEEQRLAHELERLPKELLRFLAWCAAVPVVTLPLVRHMFGEDFPAQLDAYPFLKLYYAEEGSDSERLRLQPAAAERIAAIGRERWSEAERQAWAAQAAAYYEREGDWSAAVELKGGLGHWEAALDTYERGMAALPRAERDSLHEAILRCPGELVSGRYSVLQAYLPYCEACRPAGGLTVLEHALHGGHRFRPSELSFLYERGMELCRLTGRTQQALEYMRLAENAAANSC